MINYLELTYEYYPTVLCHSEGAPDDYYAIVWESTAIDKVELDLKYFEIYRDNKISELSSKAELEITSGFISDALGYQRIYDSELEDQINLIGSTASNSTMYYACRDPITLQKSYETHTHEQLLQVLNDGKLVKLNILQKFFIKKSYILSLTNKEDVDAVTWDSDP